MPEGDTLHRTARTLRVVLENQRLVRVRSSVPAIAHAELSGHVVEAVSALGKNLLIRFDDGRVLHTHLRMRGAWHVYRPGERFFRPEHQARVILEVADALAVCFAAPTVRLLSPKEAETDGYLRGLGPDLIPDDFDEALAVRGLRELAEFPIGEAVMNQTALAGVGNIFKSETLFTCRMNPFSAVTHFTEDELHFLVQTARALLRRSVAADGMQRVTTASVHGQYWVYRRSGQPCRVCRSRIGMRYQGTQRRSTYYCPECQAVSDGQTKP